MGKFLSKRGNILDRLIINTLTAEKRFASIKNGKAERLYIEQPGQQSQVGNIYLGIVEKVVPGMNAAFVNFGCEKSGYLHRDKLPSFVQEHGSKAEKQGRSISRYVHQGERLLIQVEKDAAGSKGARLTAVIELKGRHLVYMPSGKYVAVSKKHGNPELRKNMLQIGESIKTETEGLIFRTSAVNHEQKEIEQDLQELRDLFSDIQRKSDALKKPGLVHGKDYFYEELTGEIDRHRNAEIVSDDPEMRKKLAGYKSGQGTEANIVSYSGAENIFSFYGAEHEIDKALKRVVWLENGAYLIFDAAEALTIIDVNTGKFTGKNNLEETVFAANKLAAEEIARQIRLRDLGGMILIDFIDMKDQESREEVARILESALAEDKRRTRIAGFTLLGVLQLTRKKTKLSITEALTEKCRVCSGAGHVLSSETMAFRLERELWEYRGSDYEAVLVESDSEVANFFLANEGEHKIRLEQVLGLKISFLIADSPKPFYSVRKLGNVREIFESE
ncbi:Rne/Rng family ribonuclease [Mesobacillus zeae]|uniref:Rne/Rng family ribonuclease n=1 Tax=Mesobacillus zeae TaxID=1917180 RepID=A0A398B0E9_9BACI|nr:Rne/Rng family ribonuclease [Mesobacillus zeae]